jgi:hypothetical protein
MSKVQLHPKLKANLLFTAPFADGGFSKLQGFPAFHVFEGRSLKVRINDVNIAYLIENWPDAEWDPAVVHHRDRCLDQIREADELMAARVSPLVDDDFSYNREPMDHQRRAFQISRDSKAFAYLMEQGTGKTKVVIDNACYLHKLGLIQCLIIIAWPNGVHRMWHDDEFKKDMSVPYSSQFWSANMTQKKSWAIQKCFESHRTGKLVAMTFNVEGFTSKAARECIMNFLRLKCMVVIDQSASIKNPESKRTQFLIDEIASHPNAIYRRIMDGDPVAEGADELYSQFKFLDANIIGHDTLTGFRGEFCNLGRFREVIGYRNLEKLRMRIDPYCFRVTADDCLDLPDRIYKRWDFDLSKEELRVFNELRTKSLAFFQPRPEDEEELEELPENGFIEETLAMVKNMRLQQISSGWWPEAGNFKPLEPMTSPSRLAALGSLLVAAPGKALIFARFRPDLELIQQFLGDKAVSYHGGIKENDRAEAKIKFMEDPDTLYFIGQPRNAGIGHTLTAAKHVIFYSNDYSLRLRAESEKRAHRNGLKHTLTIWDLCARRTQDKKILQAFRDKRHLAAEIMADPESFFLDHDHEI